MCHCSAPLSPRWGWRPKVKYKGKKMQAMEYTCKLSTFAEKFENLSGSIVTAEFASSAKMCMHTIWMVEFSTSFFPSSVLSHQAEQWESGARYKVTEPILTWVNLSLIAKHCMTLNSQHSFLPSKSKRHQAWRHASLDTPTRRTRQE